jgi:hypothetical protein
VEVASIIACDDDGAIAIAIAIAIESRKNTAVYW